MKEKIRAAVIGAGMIARAAHIPALLSAGEQSGLLAELPGRQVPETALSENRCHCPEE